MKQILRSTSGVMRIPSYIWVTFLYGIVHLPSLTLLPVFADEAIYIRWAQLILDEPARYAFFSMADGKPPLFMWALLPFLELFEDALFASRFFSVFVGFLTVYVLRAITREITQSKVTEAFVTLGTIILPFWFFHHRMALMDGLLTLGISLSFYLSLRISTQVRDTYKQTQSFRAFVRSGLPIGLILLLALSFGGAMMTKIPALFAIPPLLVTPFFLLSETKKRAMHVLLVQFFVLGSGILGGLLLFALLRVSPLFGALFSRSSDFSFSLAQLLSGEWRYVLFSSTPRILTWIGIYLTPSMIVFHLAGLWYKDTRKQAALLLLCAFLFFLPLTLVGRVLWPRYFLPTAIFLTIGGSIGLTRILKERKQRLFAEILLFLLIARSLSFILASYTQVESIPFVEADKTQYLYEWSAGFGNSQVRDFIVQRQQELPQDGSKKIVVLTEGSFGTLPDGLLMYFHKKGAAQNLEIHGIGVSPSAIPLSFLERTGKDEVYYVVNSHRLGLTNQDNVRLLFEVPRLSGKNLRLYQIL